MGAADPRRIVQAGVLVTARLQILDADVGPLLHLIFCAEHDRLGRARLGTGRSLTNGHAIGAKRALVRLVVDLRDARNVERTPGDAIATTDTIIMDEIDDTVGVLHDRARRWTGLEATRIFAVHTAVLADQPLEIARFRVDPFGEAHHRQAVRREIRRIVIDAVIDADLLAEIVPFQACRLARLAADAFRDVDQLRHRRELTGRRRHA